MAELENKRVRALDDYLGYADDDLELVIDHPSFPRALKIPASGLIHNQGKLEYKAAYPYKPGFVVLYEGDIWECLTATENNAPGDNIPEWKRLSNSGAIKSITINGDTSEYFGPDANGNANVTITIPKHFKGQYDTATLLNEAHPTAEAGDRAYVGTTTVTVYVWNASTLAWTDSGVGVDGGDMYKDIYDPRNIGADAFDRTKHTGEITQATVTGLPARLTGIEEEQLTFIKNIFLNGVPQTKDANQAVDLKIETAEDTTIDFTAYTGIPADTVGKNGDVHVNLVDDKTRNWYVKEAGVWGFKFATTNVTVDSALSSLSTNPVQNKVIKAALDDNVRTFTAYEGVPASTSGKNGDVHVDTTELDVLTVSGETKKNQDWYVKEAGVWVFKFASVGDNGYTKGETRNRFLALAHGYGGVLGTTANTTLNEITDSCDVYISNASTVANKPISYEAGFLQSRLTPFSAVIHIYYSLNTSTGVIRPPYYRVQVDGIWSEWQQWDSGGSTVTDSTTNGNIVVDGSEVVVYDDSGHEATTAATTTALLFDSIFGKFLDKRTQTTVENYTLAVGTHKRGASIYQEFVSDGVNAINFSADFDFFYGIASGDVLAAGTYEFYFLYKANGKVTVNVPNGSDTTTTTLTASETTTSSASAGQMTVSWT